MSGEKSCQGIVVAETSFGERSGYRKPRSYMQFKITDSKWHKQVPIHQVIGVIRAIAMLRHEEATASSLYDW